MTDNAARDVIAEPVWALIRWNVTAGDGTELRGEYAVSDVEHARGMVVILNEMWGANSHWVEPQNHTWTERVDLSRLNPKEQPDAEAKDRAGSFTVEFLRSLGIECDSRG